MNKLEFILNLRTFLRITSVDFSITINFFHLYLMANCKDNFDSTLKSLLKIIILNIFSSSFFIIIKKIEIKYVLKLFYIKLLAL